MVVTAISSQIPPLSAWKILMVPQMGTGGTTGLPPTRIHRSEIAFPPKMVAQEAPLGRWEREEYLLPIPIMED